MKTIEALRASTVKMLVNQSNESMIYILTYHEMNEGSIEHSIIWNE